MNEPTKTQAEMKAEIANTLAAINAEIERIASNDDFISFAVLRLASEKSSNLLGVLRSM